MGIVSPYLFLSPYLFEEAPLDGQIAICSQNLFDYSVFHDGDELIFV